MLYTITLALNSFCRNVHFGHPCYYITPKTRERYRSSIELVYLVVLCLNNWLLFIILVAEVHNEQAIEDTIELFINKTTNEVTINYIQKVNKLWCLHACNFRLHNCHALDALIALVFADGWITRFVPLISDGAKRGYTTLLPSSLLGDEAVPPRALLRSCVTLTLSDAEAALVGGGEDDVGRRERSERSCEPAALLEEFAIEGEEPNSFSFSLWIESIDSITLFRC